MEAQIGNMESENPNKEWLEVQTALEEQNFEGKEVENAESELKEETKQLRSSWKRKKKLKKQTRRKQRRLVASGAGSAVPAAERVRMMINLIPEQQFPLPP